jgi:hypothetical protein
LGRRARDRLRTGQVGSSPSPSAESVVCPSLSPQSWHETIVLSSGSVLFQGSKARLAAALKQLGWNSLRTQAANRKTRPREPQGASCGCSLRPLPIVPSGLVVPLGRKAGGREAEVARASQSSPPCRHWRRRDGSAAAAGAAESKAQGGRAPAGRASRWPPRRALSAMIGLPLPPPRRRAGACPPWPLLPQDAPQPPPQQQQPACRCHAWRSPPRTQTGARGHAGPGLAAVRSLAHGPATGQGL